MIKLGISRRLRALFKVVNNMSRLLLLDVVNDEVKEIDCDGLQDYYKHLGCDCFDIVQRKIAGKYFDIYIDDNGMFVEKPIVSASDSANEPMLVGNLIFANANAEGNTISLSDDDIAWIKKNIRNAAQYVGDELIHTGKMLVGCDY